MHAHVGHVDLVELGLAGDLPQRANLNTRGLHVEGEIGHASVLGHVRIGAGDEHAEVGDVGECVPHLLTVDDPFVAVLDRFGTETGKVGAGAGFGEQLTPLLLAGEHRAKEALFHLFRAVGEDRRARQGDEEHRRIHRGRSCLLQALVDDLLQLGSHAEAAVALGVHDPGEALVELMTSEFLVALGRGVVVGEKGVKGSFNPLKFSVTHM